MPVLEGVPERQREQERERAHNHQCAHAHGDDTMHVPASTQAPAHAAALRMPKREWKCPDRERVHDVALLTRESNKMATSSSTRAAHVMRNAASCQT